MTNYLFTRLNFEVPFSGAEYLNESDVSRVVNPVLSPEPGFVNWFFGGSSDSLVSYDGAHSMSQADASLEKVYGINYIQLPANADSLMNGLRTEYGDGNTHTICAVVRYSGEASQIIMGNISNAYGEGIQMTGSSVLSYVYKTKDTAQTVATAVPLPSGIAAGADIFIAITRSGNDSIAFVGGAATKLSISANRNVDTTLKFGPGNTNFTTAPGYSKSLRCYEFLYSDAALSASQLESVYANAKQRCALRGITIL
ncbi:hypothetical protein L9Y56_005566 [Klebsiella pneumoniae]|nr:hypothetical protein [Klebsiella pneumoniae]EKU3951506.1 hypothetical protein [Klebsiella pneumoniae]EKU8650615.1 hypothetical protein [Klebsiella pneumoniae]EKU8657216.1 hypothetical protein [Klebsiella pneumoniae]EKV0885999.1 hypothetical protein [Klebsiella pneumoniae]